MSRRIELGGLSLDGGRRPRQRFYALLSLSNLAAKYERATVRAILADADEEPDDYALRALRATIRDLQSLGWVERFGNELVLTRLGADVLSVAFVAIVEAPAGMLAEIHGWEIDEDPS